MKVRPVPVVLFALIACVAVSTPALAVTTVSRSGTTVTITGGDEANFLDQLTSGSLDPFGIGTLTASTSGQAASTWGTSRSSAVRSTPVSW